MNRNTPLAIAIVAAGVNTTFADTYRVPDDFPSIQTAIDGAADGDLIMIAPGEWSESIDTLGKSITIQGDGTASEVVLRSPDGDSVLFLDLPGVVTTFRDLTFTGGVADTTIRIDDASPTFERCIFRDNLRGAVSDYGSCGQTSGVTIVDSLFIDNQNVNAAGIYLSNSNSVLEGCTFIDNVAVGQGSPFVSAGAAVYVNNWDCGINSFAIRDCDFSGNSAVWGGGLYAQGVFPSAATDLIVDGCRFIDNSANEGRAMWLWYIDSDVSNTYFCGGGDQIHNGWGDQGGNTFVDDCGGAELDDCDGDRISDALAISLGLATDCNADGRPDVCTAGDPKIDADGNGIPDACESAPCPGDVTGNGIVDAADLGILLAVWETAGKNNPLADVNGDGTVDASDLGLLLGAWGLCP